MALDPLGRILEAMTTDEEATVRRRAHSLYRSLPRPLRRASILVLGSVIMIAGVAMLVLPGPGLLVMGVAVAVLALSSIGRSVWRTGSRAPPKAW